MSDAYADDEYYEFLSTPLERRLRPPGRKKKKKPKPPPPPPPPEERELSSRLQDPFATLDIEGLVLTWGLNNSAQLGLGHKNTLWAMQSVPSVLHGRKVKSLPGRPIVDVRSGDKHSIMFTKDGEVYAWGRNASGQLGVEDFVIRNKPTRVMFFSGVEGRKVSLIACGAAFTIVATEQKEVYSFGHNESGQLGLGDKVSLQLLGAVSSMYVSIFTVNNHSPFIVLCKTTRSGPRIGRVNHDD